MKQVKNIEDSIRKDYMLMNMSHEECVDLYLRDMKLNRYVVIFYILLFSFVFIMYAIVTKGLVLK